jgi:hypothetical protein
VRVYGQRGMEKGRRVGEGKGREGRGGYGKKK